MSLPAEWIAAGVRAAMPYAGEIKSEAHRQQALANCRNDTTRILAAALPLVLRDLLSTGIAFDAPPVDAGLFVRAWAKERGIHLDDERTTA